MNQHTGYQQLEAMAKVDIKTLPLLQEKALEAISLLDDPDSDFYQLIKQLSPDITAKFIEFAGSSLYGHKVHSIDHAVRLLGYQQMRQILTTSMLVEHFSETRSHFFHLEKFHKQAQLCAGIALCLGQIITYPDQAKLFTVALLNNIGKLIIAVYFPKKYEAIIERKDREGGSSIEAEQQVLGLNHAEIGSLVLKKCHLPDDICDAVRFHERENVDIEDDEAFQLLLILRTASQVANSFTLPAEEISPQALPVHLQASIREGHLIHRELRRNLQKTHGFRSIVKESLKRGGALIEQELGKRFASRPA